MNDVKKGDRFTWASCDIEITRVSRSGGYADIKVETPGGNTWTKRQPLPFPQTFIKKETA